MKAINFIKKNYKLIIIVTLVFSILLNIRQCESIKKVKNVNRQNIAALTDTIRLEKLKNGQLRYSRASYMMTIKELENANFEFSKKIKQLELRNPTWGANIGGNLSGGNQIGYGNIINEPKPPIIVRDCNTLDSLIGINRHLNNYRINWNFNDKWMNIVGHSNVKLYGTFLDSTLSFSLRDSSHFLDSYSFDVDITIAKAKDASGIERVYVTSENPNFKINQLNSINMSSNPTQKPKRFGLGLHAGPGVNISTNGNTQLGFQIGIGISYNLISF